MTETRKCYTQEFKLDAISLVMDQGFTRKEAAASLEINAPILGRWIKESKDEGGQTFRGNGKLTPDQEKIKKLKLENKRALLSVLLIVLFRRFFDTLCGTGMYRHFQWL